MVHIILIILEVYLTIGVGVSLTFHDAEYGVIIYWDKKVLVSFPMIMLFWLPILLGWINTSAI